MSTKSTQPRLAQPTVEDAKVRRGKTYLDRSPRSCGVLRRLDSLYQRKVKVFAPSGYNAPDPEKIKEEKIHDK